MQLHEVAYISRQAIRIMSHSEHRLAPTALMLGNFVTGCTVLAPAGMLVELSRDLGVTIREASLLITFGAVVLCIGSPLTAWLTGRFDRRLLLATAVAVMLAGNLASAFTTNYAVLMTLRLATLAVAALFTPQAAGTIGLIAPVEKRGGLIAYVFLGWSLAAAVGLPLISYVSSHLGWHVAFVGIAAIAAIVLALLLAGLPRGVAGVPVELATWGEVLRNPLILLLLLITCLQIAGQFAVYAFLGPLLVKIGGASPESIAIFFATYGVAGFIGNVIASRVVDRWGAYRSSLVWMGSLLAGAIIWSLGAGILPVMLIGAAIWGLGFASTNSMQQVRLVAAAPPSAGASVSLNTSVLYIGQGLGSAIGGALFARELFFAQGYVAVAFLVLSVGVLLLTKPRS